MAPPSDEASKNTSGLAAVLKSQGPVVTCVLLRHNDGSNKTTESNKTKETTPAAGASNKEEGESGVDLPLSLEHLVEEIAVDTTPHAGRNNNNNVQAVLGGPFTFVGQFPSEGVVVMARSDQPDDDLDVDELKALNMKELRFLADKLIPNYSSQTYEKKDDIVAALIAAQLPVNPHPLQPPLHRIQARGDLLLMRVAGGNEDDDDEDDAADAADDMADADDDQAVGIAIAKAMAEMKQATSVPNDDFFLHYTKAEYLAFAARTDIIVADEQEDEEDEELDQDVEGEDDGEEGEADDDGEEEQDNDEEQDDDEEQDEDEEDDDEDDAYNPLEDDGDESIRKSERSFVLNLVMGEVLRDFRVLNGRGPTGTEVIRLRNEVAAKIGLQLTPPPSPANENDDDNDDDDECAPSRRRAAELMAGGGKGPPTKRVKFDPESVKGKEEEEEEDSKPAALVKTKETRAATTTSTAADEPPERSANGDATGTTDSMGGVQ
jgi:hypothetical protein